MKEDASATRSLADQLMRALSGLLPPEVGDDIQRNMKAVLTARLRELGLVTREEFEVQSAVLARTRAKLEALQAQLDQLEGKSGK